MHFTPGRRAAPPVGSATELMGPLSYGWYPM